MKIYTKTGDSGETALWGGRRLAKDALRIQAYGTVDECNSVLGIVRSHPLSTDLDAFLDQIQNQLFVVGSELSAPKEAPNLPRIQAEDVRRLEEAIDLLGTRLKPLTRFILPGGTPTAAYLHLARTVCRRAERWIVSLHQQEPLSPILLQYMNRLSDFLFVAARFDNASRGVADVPWVNPAE